MTRIGWLDLGCGASGDMLLGAAVAAGASLAAVEKAVTSLGLPIRIVVDDVERAGLRATHVRVLSDEPDPPHRHWSDIRGLLDAADLDVEVRAGAHRAFAALAEAEGAVHGVPAEHVHFHEVGAHDAVGDVVGVVAALHDLGVTELSATPVALGSGTVTAEHGVLPVPVPAVLQLFRASGAPSYGSDVPFELCTPTGAALVTTIVRSYGPMPAMAIAEVGLGAGTRDLVDRANVVRLVLGERVDA
ncbi:MAG TPA: LarC family nickel insertion protein [Mycobacteriales bacterium]|nr:LarC family nickel insertion protein [Mycobacteriales bacterium]